MTKGSLWVAACVVLKNAKVAIRIKELRDKAVENSVIDAAYVLNRHAEIDQMDITDILNPDWTFKPLLDWPKVWRISISSIDVQEIRAGQDDPERAMGYLKRLKWPDKLKNLETLGKHVDVQAYYDQINSTNKHKITEIRRVIIDSKGKLLKETTSVRE